MKTVSNSGVECSTETEYDKTTESNTQHGLLRMCFEELQEEVGWILHGAGSLSNELEIPVHAAMLLGGFYPAFEERELDEDSDDHEHPEHFLSNMFRIGGPGPALQGEDICFKKDSGKSGVTIKGSSSDDASEVLQINPFWGDFFDVAHTGSASLLGNDIAKGCDLKRSSDGNLIFLYNTLCAETPTSGENCENHRNYLHAVETYLPPECVDLHGKRVHREYIGAVGGTPLCERRPSASKMKCEASGASRKYGLLHGNKGIPTPDLDAQQDIDSKLTQQGLWDKKNFLFRANEEMYVSKETIIALQLKDTDIGGHRLGFHVSKDGFMRLHSASMRSNPETNVDVRSWLSHVEDDFAESHFRYEYVNSAPGSAGATPPKQARDVSWRCPLHWLQTYVDDNGFDQARAPAYQRNAARFAHITGENRYAHPTVRSSIKVRELDAALFLNDALACVGPQEECHGFNLLNQTVQALVQDQDQWRKIEYVGSDFCDRLLDWPEESVKVRL
jgi:hypothetical protein